MTKYPINNKRKAFTLAEMLITIVIIGIISAIFITNFKKNFEDELMIAKLKDTFNILDQATQKMMADNMTSTGQANLTNLFSNNYFKNQFATKVKYIQNCNDGTSAGNCWHNNNIIKGLDGGVDATNFNAWAGLILNNGAMMILKYQLPTCDASYFGTPTDACGDLIVDINGFKGPNTWGKDIFGFLIDKTEIVPNGASPKDPWRSTATCTATSSGAGCTALYLKQ